MSNLTHPKSSVGACCRNAAMMLRIADHQPTTDKEQRARILKANAGQAELLHKAADIADELLEIAKRVLMTEEPRLPKGQSNYAPSFLDELRAVISKAEAA
jgi:hypothetical protein